ncbi:MAG: tetratricopeptide repeat protein [Candidatus Scalindua sp.]|nr:tetratricopeptide repeat protein [Candidatus Scalindua sp.]
MLKKMFSSFLILVALICFNNVISTAQEISRHDELIVNGNRLIVKKKYNEAHGAYDEATKLKSDSFIGWYNKGIALDLLGRYEEAIETYNRIIDLRPSSHEAWNNKGLTLARIPEKREEAIEAYNSAIQANPTFDAAWFNMAWGAFPFFCEFI